MIPAAGWLLVLLYFHLATRAGGRLGLLPIVSQLLAAALLPPLLLGLPSGAALADGLLAAPGLSVVHGVGFALLLGYILADLVELAPCRASLKIALPSFLVPFACGLACAAWALPWHSWLGAVGLGMVFAITAIPVLFLYLRSIGYDAEGVRRLLRAAILMDVLCWGLFGLAQGSTDPVRLLLPLAAALLPWLLARLGWRQPLAYSLPFFALILMFEMLKAHPLVFGVGYLLCLARTGQRLQLPMRPAHWRRLLEGVVIPLILAVGVLKVDLGPGWNALSAGQWALLLAAPVASKLAGSWLGLAWGCPGAAPATRAREAVLLNIRGLTEIVFLNLLLHQGLIDGAVYFALLLMSLVSTLLPTLAGLGLPQRQPNASRSNHGA